MDMKDLLKLGAQSFKDSQGSGAAGSNLDISSLSSALSGLTGGSKGGLDISSLMGLMQNKGMGDLVQSWLGDGQNQSISGDQVRNLLGGDKLSSFASQLGVSEDEAVGGLQDALPHMMDNASKGGSLLDSLGGAKGVMGLASKLFGR